MAIVDAPDPLRTPGESPAPIDETTAEQQEVVGLSQSQIVRRRFFRHKGAMISLIVLDRDRRPRRHQHRVGADPALVEVGLQGARPEHHVQEPTLSIRPTWLGGDGIHLGDHPFGLDNQNGKDMFAMTMRGVQTTLAVIFVLGMISTVIGVVIGALSGYYGRWVDSALMRFTDVILVIPLLLIAAVAGFALGLSGMWPVALAIGLFSWTGLARLVRAEFLALREREFVDAARVANAPSRRIIFKHILPNTVGTIVVSVTLLMGAGILTEAALGFLGFGVRSPGGVAGHARQRLPGRLLQPPVPVHLARPLHHRHRAVPAVHRRRPARRLRPAAEAHPQAQGPRAQARCGQTTPSSSSAPTCAPTRATPWSPSRPEVQPTMVTATARTRRATAAAMVAQCHLTVARSCSRRGSSR